MTTPDKINAAKAIRNLATLYRDMDAAATALEAIGSLEQATKEARAAVAAEQQRLIVVREELAAAEAKLANAAGEAVAIINEANAEAGRVAAAAAAAAGSATETARKEAERIVEGANLRSARIEKEAATRREVLEGSIDLLQGNHDALLKKIREAREELQRLETQRQAARDQIAKLLR